MASIFDLEEIKEITGDFTDNHYERIKAGQLYVLRDGGEFLGIGIIEDYVIMKAKGIHFNYRCRWCYCRTKDHIR